MLVLYIIVGGFFYGFLVCFHFRLAHTVRSDTHPSDTDIYIYLFIYIYTQILDRRTLEFAMFVDVLQLVECTGNGSAKGDLSRGVAFLWEHMYGFAVLLGVYRYWSLVGSYGARFFRFTFAIFALLSVIRLYTSILLVHAAVLRSIYVL